MILVSVRSLFSFLVMMRLVVYAAVAPIVCSYIYLSPAARRIEQ